MFSISDMHHTSVIVADTEASLKFYRDVLGLTVCQNRPDLGYPGAWLQVGEQQIHLLELPNPDAVTGRPEHGGRDRHMALLVDGYEDLKRHLLAHEIPFSESRSGRKALFCRDPDGNAVELVGK